MGQEVHIIFLYGTPRKEKGESLSHALNSTRVCYSSCVRSGTITLLISRASMASAWPAADQLPFRRPQRRRRRAVAIAGGGLDCSAGRFCSTVAAFVTAVWRASRVVPKRPGGGREGQGPISLE